jgi:hypothetical protein
MEDQHMNSLENFRARVEALEQQTEHLQHQTHAREPHTQMVERRRQWAVRAVLLPVATLHGAIGIALGSVTPAHADVIQCGDVLGQAAGLSWSTTWSVSGMPSRCGLIGVQSDHNQLINVMAESIYNPAFNIASNHNRLIDNTPVALTCCLLLTDAS